MDASHSVSVERFIFLGSNCIYPKNCLQPIKEEYILSGPLEPTNSAYAVAKLAGIELIKSYRKEFGHKWFSIMPINLYGPNDNFDLESSHVFPALIRKFTDAIENNSKGVVVWGSGNPRREFLHVDDLARAIIVCLEKYDSDEHINIGTGSDLTIKDLAEKIAKISGFKGEIIWDSTKEDGTLRKLLDIQKITKLGWKPEVSLEQGIKSTIDWYLKNK
jgi:GDP-L-fucose synthase